MLNPKTNFFSLSGAPPGFGQHHSQLLLLCISHLSCSSAIFPSYVYGLLYFESNAHGTKCTNNFIKYNLLSCTKKMLHQLTSVICLYKFTKCSLLLWSFRLSNISYLCGFLSSLLHSNYFQKFSQFLDIAHKSNTFHSFLYKSEESGSQSNSWPKK